MTKHTVSWEGNLRFSVRTPDGCEGAFDVPVDKGGDGTAPTPMDGMLHCLAACSAIDVVSILEKMRVPPTSLRVEISADRADHHPKVFTAIHLHYVVHGEVPEKKLAHALELSSDTFCSVSAMLRGTATITHDFEIIAG